VKLHQLSIPYRVLQQGIKVAAALVFAGIPSLTSVTGIEGMAAVIVMIAIAITLAVAYAVAYYRRFEYVLTADTFDIDSGVFGRREREIPLGRIQNVDISQNVVQRALGIAEVRLETAGGGTSEARLRYVGESEADRLQQAISERSTEGDEAGSEGFEELFAITNRELGLLATVATDLRLASLVFLGTILFAPSVAGEMGAQPGVAGVVTTVEFVGPLVGIAAVIALGLAGGVASAAKYYEFRLWQGPSELRYERGLLQRFSGTIPLARVQTLTVEENVLARQFGYASLFVETAGGGGGGDRNDQMQSAIPIAKRERVTDLAQSIEPFGDPDFERPPKRARTRYAFRYALVLLGLASLLFAVGQVVDGMALRGLVGSVTDRWYAPLAGLVVVPVAAHLAWVNRGYYFGDSHVVTRNGFWVRKTSIVPYHRVQTVFSSKTLFQRRRSLGTVVVDTAGSRSLTGDDTKAVDIDDAVAEDVRERVTERLLGSLRRRRQNPSIRSPSNRNRK
jgi:putative membrane protein